LLNKQASTQDPSARATPRCAAGALAQLGFALWLLAASFGLAAAPAAAEPPPALLDEAALLDRLLSVADERLALMPGVAAAKWPRHLPIADAVREQEVLRDATTRAARAGLAADAVSEYFALQMSSARTLQERLTARWTATGFDFAGPPADLAGELRPHLDAITRDSLLALYLIAPFATDPGFGERAARLAAARLPAERWSDSDRAALVARMARITLALPSSPERARGAGVVRFGTPGDYAPYSLARDGELTGTDVELAERLARELGLRPEFIRSSWRSLTADLLADRFDVAVGGVSVTVPRAANGVFSVAIGRSGKTAIGRCSDARRFARFEDIDRPTVAVVFNPGGTNDAFVHRHLTRARLVEHADNRTIFDDLESRRADVMFTDETEVALASRRHPDLCRLIPDAFEPADKAFLMPKTGDWPAAVDPWLRREIAGGTPGRLLEQYLTH
jgi:cyclohexadienyl dehydratase